MEGQGSGWALCGHGVNNVTQPGCHVVFSWQNLLWTLMYHESWLGTDAVMLASHLSISSSLYSHPSKGSLGVGCCMRPPPSIHHRIKLQTPHVPGFLLPRSSWVLSAFFSSGSPKLSSKKPRLNHSPSSERVSRVTAGHSWAGSYMACFSALPGLGIESA